ncbi:MAG: outer membrane lipoprotein carrier protein LolA [Proteobacteria bacterium]|nr:outer membrane lipoprotein carrier protein LolA [Pseudomonadota bacterium]
MTRTFAKTVVISWLVMPFALAGDEVEKPVDAELSGVLSGVEAKYKDVGALSARFVQTSRSSVFGDEVQAGELKVKRPSMMRWTFEGDGGKEFVTDGSTMWIHTKADNQVLKYEDVASMKSQADSLLQSLDRLNELFEVAIVDDGDDAIHTLSLSPREGEAQFKSLNLVLDGEYLIQGVTMKDAFDNVTELAFSEVNLKAELADSAFAFTVPEGAQLVEAGSF